MVRSSLLSPLVVVGVVAWLFGAAGLDSVAVYEDWSGTSIRADRWVVGHAVAGPVVNRPLTHDRRLMLRYRQEGSTASDSGQTVAHEVMQLLRHTLINEIEAAFTVTELSMSTCAANNAGRITQARPARLHMEKFNDGSSSRPGDRTGDYIAIAQAFRDGSSLSPPGVLNVQGAVSRCTDPACATVTPIVINTLPTTVAIGQTFTLRLKWDQPNRQFLFGLDGSRDVALAYAINSITPPALPQVEILVQHAAANCVAGAVVIDSATEVGRISTNGSAVVR